MTQPATKLIVDGPEPVSYHCRMETKTALPPRDCLACQGVGTSSYNEKETCRHCLGAKTFECPDFDAIITALVATRGKNKGGVKAAAPTYQMRDRTSCRIYYTWRTYRFDAGLDVTMPMMAGIANAYDPFQPELDLLAGYLAYKVTGKKVSIGAVRWGSAMGLLDPGAVEKAFGPLGATAQSGGPEADENKPEEEASELR